MNNNVSNYTSKNQIENNIRIKKQTKNMNNEYIF